MRRIKSLVLHSGLLLLAPLIVILCYWPGLGGEFHFDDAVNLAGLKGVTDRPSFLGFVFSGANPLFGRPLALASFALQAGDWPDRPQSFLLVNFAIHGLNVLLVAIFATLVANAWTSRQHPSPQLRRTVRTAVFLVAVLWGILPIHASASMLIVQRMTTLASSFMLLGLIAYVLGRRIHERSPRLGVLLIVGVMPLSAFAALLAKEIGILTPLYCWVLESCLLSGRLPPRDSRLTWLLRVLFAAPVAGMVVVMVLKWPEWQVAYTHRLFSVWDRLLAQPLVWLDYLKVMAMPRSTAISPFFDDFPLPPGFNLSAAAAWLGWASVGVAAFLGRHRFPLLWFAIAWFLVGHSLEGSVIPLELYFQHRNYLPSVGLVLSLGLAGISLQRGGHFQAVRLLSFVAAIYGLLLCWVLVETASLWGHPRVAAELWAANHPNSERASIYHVQRLIRGGQWRQAAETAFAAADRNPGNSGLQMTAIHLACVAGTPEEILRYRDTTLARLPSGSFSMAAARSLEILNSFVQGGTCPGLAIDHVQSMAERLLGNPRYARHGGVRSIIETALGDIHSSAGRSELAQEAYGRALAAYPTLNTIYHLAQLLWLLDRQDEAAATIRWWRTRPPAVGAYPPHWQSELDLMLADLRSGRLERLIDAARGRQK